MALRLGAQNNCAVDQRSQTCKRRNSDRETINNAPNRRPTAGVCVSIIGKNADALGK